VSALAVKQRFIRDGDELRDDDVVVIRGGLLDPEILRTDALRNHAVYGTFGISVFAVRDATLDEMEQQAPLVRFAELTLMTVGAIHAVGLRLEPTGRNPRHFDVGFDDLDEGVERLCSCEHRVVTNPYHEA
jgi:hypothetical protein